MEKKLRTIDSTIWIFWKWESKQNGISLGSEYSLWMVGMNLWLFFRDLACKGLKILFLLSSCHRSICRRETNRRRLGGGEWKGLRCKVDLHLGSFFSELSLVYKDICEIIKKCLLGSLWDYESHNSQSLLANLYYISNVVFTWRVYLDIEVYILKFSWMI